MVGARTIFTQLKTVLKCITYTNAVIHRLQSVIEIGRKRTFLSIHYIDDVHDFCMQMPNRHFTSRYVFNYSGIARDISTTVATQSFFLLDGF